MTFLLNESDEVYIDSHHLVAALLVYQSSNSSPSSFYIERHGIYPDKNGSPRLKSGTPMDQKFVDTLAEYYERKRSNIAVDGFIPERLLGTITSGGQRVYVWHIPPGKRQIFFKAEEVSSGEAHLPQLIFRYDVIGNDLQVFALRVKRRPTSKTPLYRPPFFNCYSDGRICFGNVRIDPGTSFEEMMENVESAFFNSYFTHTIGNATLKNNLSLEDFWKGHIDSGNPFPVDLLVPARMKLKDIFNNM